MEMGNREWRMGKEGERWNESNNGILRENVIERECDEF